MSSEEKIKIFKRFLKEQGVYNRAMWLYANYIARGKKNVIAALSTSKPWEWLSDMDIFCLWSATDEGRKLWAKINILWRMLIVERNIDLLDGELKQALKSICESIEGYEEEDSYEKWCEQEFIIESKTKLNELKKLVKKWRIKC